MQQNFLHYYCQLTVSDAAADDVSVVDVDAAGVDVVAVVDVLNLIFGDLDEYQVEIADVHDLTIEEKVV